MHIPELYPPEWKQLAEACKRRANWTCQKCGIRHGMLTKNPKGWWYIAYVSAAHRNPMQNPRLTTANDLICLCQRCHMHHDALFHRRKRSQATARGMNPREIVQMAQHLGITLY